MKFKFQKLGVLVAMVLTISSCTTYNHAMREPNTRVNLSKSDFALSDQVVAEAKTVTILGIDWSRIFSKKSGTIQSNNATLSSTSIPVLGNFATNKTANYALYELMQNHPGYDVVFYPQYETKTLRPVFGLGFLTKITTVKTTARLGKLTN